PAARFDTGAAGDGAEGREVSPANEESEIILRIGLDEPQDAHAGLFDNVEGLRIRDICANRHGGNPESVATFERVAHKIPEMTRAILDFARSRRGARAHCARRCERFGKAPNEVSGRLTDLKRRGLLRKCGRRNGAANLIAAELLSQVLTVK